jgi:hypothetical protein
MALHRARQAGPERFRRKFQRPLPATSASTSTCSVACRWHGGSLKPGGSIYNACRPHTSLGGLAPNPFAARSQQDHNRNGFWL